MANGPVGHGNRQWEKVWELLHKTIRIITLWGDFQQKVISTPFKDNSLEEGMAVKTDLKLFYQGPGDIFYAVIAIKKRKEITGDAFWSVQRHSQDEDNAVSMAGMTMHCVSSPFPLPPETFCVMMACNSFLFLQSEHLQFLEKNIV